MSVGERAGGGGRGAGERGGDPAREGGDVHRARSCSQRIHKFTEFYWLAERKYLCSRLKLQLFFACRAAMTAAASAVPLLRVV